MTFVCTYVYLTASPKISQDSQGNVNYYFLYLVKSIILRKDFRLVSLDIAMHPYIHNLLCYLPNYVLIEPQ